MFTDRDLVNDCVCSQKLIENVYSYAIQECVDNNLRQDMINILKEEYDCQKLLWDTMNSRGWYKTNGANPNELKTSQNEYNDIKNRLNNVQPTMSMNTTSSFSNVEKTMQSNIQNTVNNMVDISSPGKYAKPSVDYIAESGGIKNPYVGNIVNSIKSNISNNNSINNYESSYQRNKQSGNQLGLNQSSGISSGNGSNYSHSTSNNFNMTSSSIDRKMKNNIDNVVKNYID